MPHHLTDLIHILSFFEIKGKVTAIEELENRYIHDTYVVKSSPDNQPAYLLQRINHTRFKDIPAMMDNISLGTDHLRAKLQAVRGTKRENLHAHFSDALEKYDYLTEYHREYFLYHKIAEQQHADFSEYGFLSYARESAENQELLTKGIELLTDLWDDFYPHNIEFK